MTRYHSRRAGRTRSGLLWATLLLSLLAVADAWAQDPGPQDLLGAVGRDLTPLVRALNAPQSVPRRAAPGTSAPATATATTPDGKARFAAFVEGAVRALEAHPELAAEVGAPPHTWDPELRDLLVGGYATRGLGAEAWQLARDLLLEDTQAGADGALSPERWKVVAARLETLASGWGMTARRRGDVLELSTGRGRGATALGAAVVDTAPPRPGHTRRPVRTEGPLTGPGVPTKAGLVAALFALRGVHDAGLETKGRATLVVSPRGQAATERGATLLPRGGRDRADFALGCPFPAVRAENGAGEITVVATPDPPAAATGEGAPGFRVLHIEGTAGTCTTGGCEASASLHPRSVSQRAAVALARRGLRLFAARSPGLEPRVDRDGDPLLRVSVRCGPAGGAASPCDALASLLTFIDQELGAFPDARGRLVRLVAQRVVALPDGSGLDLALAHPTMPGSAVRLVDWIERPDGACVARLGLGWPPGRSGAQAVERAQRAIAAFAQAEGGPLHSHGAGVSPHELPAEDATLGVLLAAYGAQTRKPGPAIVASVPSAAKGWGPAACFGPLPPTPGGAPLLEQRDSRLTHESFLVAVRVYAAAWLRLLERPTRP